MSLSAVTVAARGPWSRRASSPKKEPGPIVATLRPCWVAVAVPRRPRRTRRRFRPLLRESFLSEPRSRRRSQRSVSAHAWHMWRTARRRSASGSWRRGPAAGRPCAELTAHPPRRRGAAFRGAGAPWSRRGGAPAPRRCGGRVPRCCGAARVAFLRASLRGRSGGAPTRYAAAGTAASLRSTVGRAHDVLAHPELLRARSPSARPTSCGRCRTGRPRSRLDDLGGRRAAAGRGSGGRAGRA